jgi:hypothetical protein
VLLHTAFAAPFVSDAVVLIPIAGLTVAHASWYQGVPQLLNPSPPPGFTQYTNMRLHGTHLCRAVCVARNCRCPTCCSTTSMLPDLLPSATTPAGLACTAGPAPLLPPCAAVAAAANVL